MKVVITDCRYKMSLAPLRALHRAGYRTCCGDSEDVPEKLWLGSRSSSCDEVLRWSGRETARSIAALCDPGDVVLPVGRETLRAFAACPALGKAIHVLVSPPSVLEAADDKARVWALAREAGVPVPETVLLSDSQRPEDAADSLPYPCILKYRNGEALGLKSWERYAIVRNREEFMREYARMNAISPSPLIQQYLEGRDLGVAVVMDRDCRPVDFLCYVSDREYPLSGGPTCLCRTIFDRRLLKYACTLLQALHFQGVAMLDFKGSVEEPYLLEVNPRIWGSAALAEIAGSTFFESWVNASMDRATPLDLDICQPSYALDVRMRFAPYCFLAAMAELGRGRWRSGLSDLASSVSPHVRDGLLRRGDRKPGRRYLWNLLGKARE